MITIWHNPRCSKSRAALALLQAAGHDPSIRRYLEDTPTQAELRAALAALGQPARALIRSGESAFRGMGLTLADPDARLIAAMAQEPGLIERPVVFRGAKAVIGRPPEAVLTLL